MTLINRICRHCDNMFEVIPRDKSQIFCNISCYNGYLNSKKVIKICKTCSKSFQHNEPTRKFCSKSCAAKYNNSVRDKDSRKKQSMTLRSTLASKPPILKIPKPKKLKVKKIRPPKEKKAKISKKIDQIIGPYSKIFILICAHSGERFVSRTVAKYAPEYRHLYSREGKAVYKFTFNVYEYPELFDLDLINKYGWYSVGGKSNKPINKEGCSRDHKVSVNEAISNGYDPFYIKHPLNCTVMRHADNIRKYSRSSMTYAQLVKLVDDYERSKWR